MYDEIDGSHSDFIFEIPNSAWTNGPQHIGDPMHLNHHGQDTRLYSNNYHVDGRKTIDDFMGGPEQTRTVTTATIPSIHLSNTNEYDDSDLERTDPRNMMHFNGDQNEQHEQHEQQHAEDFHIVQNPFVQFAGVILSIQYVAPSRILGVSAAYIKKLHGGHLPSHPDINDETMIYQDVREQASDAIKSHITIETAEFREEGGVADFVVLSRVIFHTRPDIIIVPSGIDPSIFDKLEMIRTSKSCSDHLQILIAVQDAATFNFDRAIRRISFTSVRVDPQFSGTTPVNTSKKQLCRSLGGLLAYLDHWSDQSDANHSEASKFVSVHAIQPLFPCGVLHIDSNTASAMSIFESEVHPSKMGLGTTKEGLSLYGMYQSFCSSCIGKQAMKAWMSNPLDDIKVIGERLASVSYLIEYPRTIDILSKTIEPIADVLTLIRRFG